MIKINLNGSIKIFNCPPIIKLFFYKGRQIHIINDIGFFSIPKIRLSKYFCGNL